MRPLNGFATLILLCLTFQVSANYTDDYIQGYKDIAQREMQRSGIPASIILAQGIFESAWGRGKLALNSNNHFGIKCKDYWEGPTYFHKDDDYVNGKLIRSCFRAYNSVEDSYIDHTNFLLQTKHYQDLFDYDETDYRNWAYGLKRCGYATDPSYAEKLIGLIERYDLQEFDQLSFYAISTTNITPVEEVLEAPAYYIPEAFLQEPQPVATANNFVPVNETVSNNSTNNEWPAQNVNTQHTVFEYEVTAPAAHEELSIEVPVHSSASFSEPEIMTSGNIRTSVTSVMPNRTANDQRLKNLSRRPRMSVGAGPR